MLHQSRHDPVQHSAGGHYRSHPGWNIKMLVNITITYYIIINHLYRKLLFLKIVKKKFTVSYVGWDWDVPFSITQIALIIAFRVFRDIHPILSITQSQPHTYTNKNTWIWTVFRTWCTGKWEMNCVGSCDLEAFAISMQHARVCQGSSAFIHHFLP